MPRAPRRRNHKEKYKRERARHGLILVRVDRSTHRHLLKVKEQTGRALAEQIRTYIQWGMEVDRNG